MTTFRLTSIFSALLLAVSVSAQTPVESLSLTDITFVRQSFERNFYSDRIPVSQLKLDGTTLMLENSADLVIEGDKLPLRQYGTTLEAGGGRAAKSTIRVGAFHPYLCYEAEFKDITENTEVGISFYANDGSEATRIVFDDGYVKAYKSAVGAKAITLSKKRVNQTESIRLRVQYTGQRFHVFVMRSDGSFELLFSVAEDMRASSTCITHSFGIFMDIPAGEYIQICRAASYLSCGTGQADPQVVQHRDGTPYIKDGRLYVCFTTRGFEMIPDSYQGVYSIGLNGFGLKLEGALFFGEGDGLLHGFHATKVVYDDASGEFLVITTSHGGDHTLAWASSKADILHGMHYLECSELMFPHCYTADHSYNTEDPDFFYDDDAGEWRLAYCAVVDKSYVTFLAGSKDWNGPYHEIAKSPKNNNTGIRIVTIGGKRQVLSGGPDTTFYIYDYPTLQYEGTFNQQYANGGFRGWPTIVPIPYGNYERYLWITFDRGAITGRYSYGTLYFYLGDKMIRKY